MNQSSPLTPYLYMGHNWGMMGSEIQLQANEFLRIITPQLDDSQLEYLSWRVCGFSKSEAMGFAYISKETEHEWAADEAFRTVEDTAIGQLQETFADEIMSRQQKRNARVVSGIDNKVIQKAFFQGIDMLSSSEFAYLSQIRNQYNPEVRRILSDQTGKTVTLPDSFDEYIIMMRNRNKDDSNQSQDSPIEADFIEAEYTKSPELQAGDEARTEQEDTL